jgi:MIP family channel proteins
LYSIAQKLAAEFLGTFAVVLLSAGVLCAEQYLRDANQPGFGPLGYALAYGLAVAAMVGTLGRISGAHLNPALSIGAWVTRRIGTIAALSYCVAQLLGGLAAAYLLLVSLPDTNWRAEGLTLITPSTIADFSRWDAMVLECILTAILAFVYFASSAEKDSAFPRSSGLFVGFTVTVETLFAAPFTGAAMNPARCLGPALVTHHWQNHGVYWVGPLAGGIIGAVLYDAIFAGSRRHHG